MPSVGMRRSTRVFGARVLRSGRRLSTAQYDGNKHIRATHGEDKWNELLHDTVDGGGDAGDRCKSMWQENQIDPANMAEEVRAESEVEMEEVSRTCKVVYTRKRKRSKVESANVSSKEDLRFGKKYARRQWQKKRVNKASKNLGNFGGFALAVNRSDYDCGYVIACLLISIVSYMAKVRVGMRQLWAFLQSKPICDVYSSRGILLVKDSIAARSLCFSVVSQSNSLIPQLSMSFSAVPSLFMRLQTSLHFRFAIKCSLFVAHSSAIFKDIETSTVFKDSEIATDGIQEQSFQLSITSDQRYCSDVVKSDSDGNTRKEVAPSSPGLPKHALRNLQMRNSRKIKKRRTSLRRKRGRPPLAFRALKTSGAVQTGVSKNRQEGVQATAPAVRGSYKSSSANIKGGKSNMGLLTQDAVANCCSANLLVSVDDKCYREEGVIVALEQSASNQWSIVVSKNGTKRYNLIAQKAMRPSGTNRITHATIWTAADSAWKLEFPNKQEWLFFKDLYKDCYERNLQSSSVSVIPVPKVREVSNDVDPDSLPYARPNVYITVKDDELTRTLGNKRANYDMDSDDEAWLSNLNEQFSEGSDFEVVTPDKFELVIDGIEKAAHCNPDELLDDQAVYDFCRHLERKEVVEAIHNYWIKKRKQNHSALVRIFQLYQPKRIQVLPKCILRKKRSFKRQTSQGGRVKQRPLLQAIAAKQDVSDQQNVHKLQEAKASAERFEDLAIQKRQRAQKLMENADLATYRALMALRIAEEAEITEKPDTLILG
ncbi:uncharacterized protein LOC127244841 [Andrographis paniculata]|uniref:uncharacterized protein LOC127244841 n=1 Tax=Andrographis paniculata TaxID=175694 RepID=UPI0021E78864|nr:uncharacterized protein LOC127244841 [Andrographis paniculata]XP_051121324.1 uncharacterized protein LOC127244841 [Andrographis paniculata]XP_051121325.1 uncharacterized protein LOC127244841 [Andrographis paniculata]XP_051121326.1 uncharacterized protein LOC127244841 [Andrographis paniculata]